jgi:hypothetical protein
VKRLWEEPTRDSNILDKVHFKLGKVRKFLKGWGYNRAGMVKKMKKEIVEDLEIIEQKEDAGPLDLESVRKRCILLAEMLKILEEEELHWFKRNHEIWLLQGDNNTDFFHRVANGRKHKHTLYVLENGLNHITGDEELLKYATSYYKTLFGHGSGNAFALDPSLWPLEDYVSNTENEELIKPFDLEEIQYVLFQIEKNKACGPDGFPIEFYQTCWLFIKEDMLELFTEFHANSLDIKD